MAREASPERGASCTTRRKRVRRRRAEEPVAATPESVKKGTTVRHLLHACTGLGQGGGLVAASSCRRRPDQGRSAEGADGRLLAELPERGRRVMPPTEKPVTGRTLGRRELFEDLAAR